MRAIVLVLAASFCALPLAAQEQPAPAPAPTAAATPEAAALAGWDDETGIWFPPDAPRQVYLDRSDPEHFLITDVQKAYKANRALARAVAALLGDPKRQPLSARLSDRVKQLKTMFDMVTAGYFANEEEKTREDDAWREVEQKYERWMDVERARALPLAERRAASSRVFEESQYSPKQDVRLRGAFAMLGLLPQGDNSIYTVLDANPWQNGLPGPKFVAFLRRVLEREAADGRPEAGRWQMALRNFHFYRGELEKARALSRSFLGREDLEIWENDNRVFSALLERLAGDPAPLRAAIAACVVPENLAADWQGVEPAAYCRFVVHLLSVRLSDRLLDKAPRSLVEVLTEDTVTNATDWPTRLDSIRHLEMPDPAQARTLAEDLLRVPATISPLAARLDALMVVGRTSRMLKDFVRAQGAWDRYLANLRYQPAPVPPDLWARVAAVPESETKDGPPGSGWFEITTALAHKAEVAIDAHDYPLARKSIEEMVAASIALADSSTQKPEELWKLVDAEGASEEDKRAMQETLQTETESLAVTARVYLRWARYLVRDLGESLQKTGQHAAEARRVAQYLLGNVGGDHNFYAGLMALKVQAEVKGEPFPPVATPWGPPVVTQPRAAEN